MMREAVGAATMLAVLFAPIAIASRRELASWWAGFRRDAFGGPS